MPSSKINMDIILSHEVAHFIDYMHGDRTLNKESTDNKNTTEYELAVKYRRLLWKSVKKQNKTLTNYQRRTCECFARMFEQNYALSVGIDLSELSHIYLPKDIFVEEIKPLVDKYLEELKLWLSDSSNYELKTA